jgi:hypothetical protein
LKIIDVPGVGDTEEDPPRRWEQAFPHCGRC